MNERGGGSITCASYFICIWCLKVKSFKGSKETDNNYDKVSLIGKPQWHHTIGFDHFKVRNCTASWILPHWTHNRIFSTIWTWTRNFTSNNDYDCASELNFLHTYVYAGDFFFLFHQDQMHNNKNSWFQSNFITKNKWEKDGRRQFLGKLFILFLFRCVLWQSYFSFAHKQPQFYFVDSLFRSSCAKSITGLFVFHFKRKEKKNTERYKHFCDVFENFSICK